MVGQRRTQARKAGIVSAFVVSLAVFVSTAPAHAQVVPVHVVLQEGDTPAGAGGAAVVNVFCPTVNGSGQVGFIGYLDSSAYFVWFDSGVAWLNTSVSPPTLFTNGTLARMGISDSGGWIHATTASDNLVGYQPALYSDEGLVHIAGHAAGDYVPGFPTGAAFSAFARPSMNPDGTIYYMASVDTDGDWLADATALYRDLTPILKTGDQVSVSPGSMSIASVESQYDASNDNQHYVTMAKVDSGSVQDDDVVVVDGVAVAREGDPTGVGGLSWEQFAAVAINNAGNYLLEGNDGEESFLAYNGAISIREGDTVAGITLSNGQVTALAINDHNHAVHIWNHDSSQVLFHSCEAANLAASATPLLQTGDSVDVDGDGLGDAVVVHMQQSTSELSLGEDMGVFVIADLDYNAGAVSAIVRLDAFCCGDGIVDSNEGCDDGGESATCNDDCSVSTCGDGIINVTAGEACDDEGETAACDGDCTVPSCGDAVVNIAAGEECDDGGESIACNADCTIAVCGDAILNVTAKEECDDGNTIDGDGCSSACELNSVCGNGLDEAGEQCDDGNTIDGDGCSSTCEIESIAECGNGVNEAGEQCDDGNTIDGDGCSSTCEIESGSADEGGCGCVSAGSSGTAGLSLYGLLPLWLVRRRRRDPR